MGVIFKRMMYRAAGAMAHKLKVETLITGESVAQVSSQTLANLAVIDRVTEKLVLRPLAMFDKREIIDIARKIGTEEFVKNIPEYCGVISVKPTTRARLDKIEQQEALFNNDVLQAAIDNAEIQMIDRVMEGYADRSKSVRECPIDNADTVVIDIRHPDEEEKNPLGTLEFKQEVLIIPFYELRKKFGGLSQDKQYALYCDRGIMSRLHASHLQEMGHVNVTVFNRV
jgi:thiamine biosynthesis protein ThiI